MLLTMDSTVSESKEGVEDLHPMENNCKIILVRIKPEIIFLLKVIIIQLYFLPKESFSSAKAAL
jgi:hypothetical protein